MLRQYFLGGLVFAFVPLALADSSKEAMQPRQAIYYWASQANLTNVLRLKQLGYSLDMQNDQGLTPACEAVYKDDVVTFKTLQMAGADMRSSCLFAIPLSVRQVFAQNYQSDHTAIFIPTTETLVKPVDVATDTVAAEEISVAYKSDNMVSATPVSSVFRPYVSLGFLYGKTSADLKANSSDMNKSYDMSDTKPGISLAFGYRMNDARVELEGRYSGETSDRVMDGSVTTKLQSGALMLNAFYDIPTGIALRPYVMAGIGGAYNSGKISTLGVSYKNSDYDVAWQLGCGVAYSITDHLSADLGYRYTNYGAVDVVKENLVDYKLDDIDAHNITLGLRYEL